LNELKSIFVELLMYYIKKKLLNVKGETNERKMKIMGIKTNREKDKKFLDYYY
jgi:hypothetical protein